MQYIAHFSILFRKFEPITTLSNKKFHVNWNFGDVNGYTPTLFATENVFHKFLDKLLQNGASSYTVTSERNSIVYLGVPKGYNSVINI
jgi:hypothetical protein